MSKASNKWYLLYLRATYNYGALEARIVDKEFDNELDMLVWASKSRIPKAVGQHFTFGPNGLGRLPTEEESSEYYGADLTAVIDSLLVDRVHKQAGGDSKSSKGMPVPGRIRVSAPMSLLDRAKRGEIARDEFRRQIEITTFEAP